MPKCDGVDISFWRLGLRFEDFARQVGRLFVFTVVHWRSKAGAAYHVGAGLITGL